MIIKYEVELFIKEIEANLPKLTGKALENALDKISMLSRINLEFMEYEDLMRKLALQHNKTIRESIRYWDELNKLKTEVNYLKENIK